MNNPPVRCAPSPKKPTATATSSCPCGFEAGTPRRRKCDGRSELKLTQRAIPNPVGHPDVISVCPASTLLYGSISERHVGHLSLQQQLQTSTHCLPSFGHR